MATILQNPDQTMTLTLTPAEQDTFSNLPIGQLEAYVTLWLKERAPQVLQDRFNALSADDQSTVLSTLRTASAAPAKVVGP